MRKGSTGSSTACRSGRKQLLVFAPNWIGDVVMATPFLSILRKQNPDDFITVFCREYVSELLARSSFPDVLLTYGRKGGIKHATLTLRRGTPDGGWDAAFLLPMSFSSAIVAYLGGTRRRIGYRTGGRDWLITDPVSMEQHRKIHLSEEYARFAAQYSGESHEHLPFSGGSHELLPEPCVVPPYDWKESVEGFGISGRYAVFAAGAKYGPAKLWPEDRYISLARRLSGEAGLKPVLIGSPDERAYLDNITSKVDGLNLSGRSGIGDMMSVMRGAELVVGNDSGPVHVSAAMGVPTVSIFGSTSPLWTSPRGHRSRVVTSGADCSPCFRKECPEGDTHCLRDIDVDDVFEAAIEIMRESTE